ncbi:hypothetical protein [Planococcus sp. CAU13]|uniref:hypothetical protein n=1 Tax=Planococcus sp. CAU13 TaxID=1541197 RepID=UPI00053000D9|nr:hypothetical protein [Planococcus sp. CAU13]
MSHWFAKLREYFPAKEMKSESHMKKLLMEKKGLYKVDEGPHYTLVYFEKPDYVFIDYILVSSSSRGSGLGSKVISKMKEKNKLIILEVDPVSPEDPETEKRVRFYQKQNFKKAPSIQYERIHPVTGEKSVMDIFYWSKSHLSDEYLVGKMKNAYEEVHAYKNEELYGITPQPANQVLQLRQLQAQKAE